MNIIVTGTDNIQQVSQEKINDDKVEFSDHIYNGVINYEEKRRIKQQAKDEIKKKFIVNAVYYLKNNKIKREYILKKFIYTINETIVNIVVMKQISGPKNDIFTLNRYDCLRYHIKYEEGLQVFSMSMNWVLKRKRNDNKKAIPTSTKK